MLDQARGFSAALGHRTAGLVSIVDFDLLDSHPPVCGFGRVTDMACSFTTGGFGGTGGINNSSYIVCLNE